MTPTPQQIRDEVASGPLAADLAPHWADVFPAHDKPEMAWRTGALTPDAAYAIRSVLTDPTRRTKPGDLVLSRGAFLAALAGLAPALAAKDAATQQKWGLLLNLATGGDSDVRVSRPEIQALLDAAVADGLMAAATRDSLRPPTTVPCSRAEELGWDASWPYELVIRAKAL